MAVIQTSESGRSTAYLKEFIFESPQDLYKLPVAPECKIGSTAICFETSELFMLCSDNTWQKFGGE